MVTILPDFSGRRIRMPDERRAHILREHSYMAGLWDELAETLLAPEEIRRSKSDPESVRLYHKWYYGTTEGDKWVCVVVKTFPDDAFVITALVTPTIKGGDPL